MTETPHSLREIEREAAPAAADVEHALPRLQQQLGGDMALLVGLRLLDGLIGREEVGAGILPVGVEEKIVERVREVVVMRHVLARAVQGIVLLEDAEGAAETIIKRCQQRARRQVHVLGDEVEEIVDARILDRQLAVHEGLAEIKARVEEQLAPERRLVQPHGHCGAGLAGEAVDGPAGINHAKRAAAHEMTE